jgi:hypothetical protein
MAQNVPVGLIGVSWGGCKRRSPHRALKNRSDTNKRH